MAEALRALLGMAPSTQAYFYNEWRAACERPGASIASARTAAPGSDRVADEHGAAGSEFEAEEWAAIDMVEKVDMTNKVKLALIHRKLGRNSRVVNFWLAYCLFPRETNQFEKWMSASAWDLRRAGVRQNDLPALQGTSGKMLDLLLRDGSYTTLKAGASPSWQAALDLCMARGVDALLDAGAFLRTRLSSSTSPAAVGRTSKLRPDALALLTLSARMTKDKLMQAAGRMRQLDKGRRLAAAGGERGAEQQATEEGLMHATLQGVHFGSTYGAPHRALVDDDLSLWTMYQSALAEEWAAQKVDRMVSQGQARCDASGGLDGDMATMLAGIRARGRKYGGDFLVVVSLASLGGECER
eukprot:jgi/Mesvir1/21538/Mv03979-RA.1